jgi:para-aminobenzoate synthetase component 1
MRQSKHLHIEDIEAFKRQLTEWAREESSFILLDSDEFPREAPNKKDYHYDFIAAFGCLDSVSGNENNGFDVLEEFLNQKSDWVFGYLSYDLKNGLENLDSSHPDHLDFPALYFFQPEFVFLSEQGKIQVQTISEYTSNQRREEILEAILTKPISGDNKDSHTSINIQRRFSKEEYLKTVNTLQKHIRRGDIYEVNFCQEFYSNQSIDPYHTYNKLSKISPAPFGCFFKKNDQYLLSSSPERFMRKQGNTVISQPIKGTRPRGRTKNEDQRLRDELFHDRKERAENVMIVDLVRNDLSRTALQDSVKVKELYGIYSFEQVHQMISTISCEIDDGDYLKCIKNCFPMGSMTGAPKIRAMELIEQYENTRRGLYSGAVGYFSPEKNFDFNVVIRSILYNSLKKYVSFSVGGAITYLSDPSSEYEECLVKADGMRKVLNNNV